jgi:hypothetical protein
MLGILLHGGDLSGGAWLFILFVLALAGTAILAAFVGVLYLINKRRPPVKAVAIPTDGLETELLTNE